MHTRPRTSDLRAALVAGLLLCAASAGLLWTAEDVVDASAIAGAVAGVLACALLALTVLSWRWSARGAAYVDVDMGLREDELTVRHAIAVDEDAAAI